MSFDPSRLLIGLQNTGLQSKDPPLYQVIRDLIKATAAINTSVSSSTSGSGGTTTNTVNQTNFYDVGTLRLQTEQFLIQARFLKLQGAERLTLEGTTRVVLGDFGYTATVLLAGQPRWYNVPFTVPNNYFLMHFNQLILTNNIRASLLGNATLILTDDFGTRSRISLVGAGT